MVITCEQCQARFRLADEKLKPEGTKVRCSKCKLVFTVFPPDFLAAGGSVDSTDLTPERGPDEETVQEPIPTPVSAPPTPPEPLSAPDAASPATGGGDLDFSGLEQSMGPGTGSSDLAEEFSFADTTVAAPEPPPEAGFAPETDGNAFSAGISTDSEQPPGELDFDATFAESEELPTAVAPAIGPSEFAFDEELANSEAGATPTEATAPSEFDFGTETEATAPSEFDFGTETEATAPSEFDFSTETDAPAPGEFDFGTETDAPAPSEFDFDTETETPAPSEFDATPGEAVPASGEFEFADEGATAEPSDFRFEAEVAAGTPAPGENAATLEEPPSFEFGTGDSFESSSLSTEAAFGDAADSWDQPGKQEGLSFDFDEPNFETKEQEPVSKGRDEAGLSFGEIDFSGDDDDKAPSFSNEPDFSQATIAPEPAPLPLSSPPPTPRAEARRGPEPPPVPLRPSKKSVSPALVMLVLVLVLCGAAGYYFFMGNGRQLIDSMLLKVKGEVPPAPVEQLIALNITGSSYVKNRDAGQLLVVQGTTTNNFPATRNAISVKGVLLDAGGKVLQQQTIFCGNYLDEEKLGSMKYAQIEEAMNNQFGDSLANVNVSPGKVLRFTIVFRNVPKEMANINVEVVDSKPGGP